MKIDDTNSQVIYDILCAIKGKGSKIAISTSNTRKIIAIIKNRNENGIREFENGSNPHSKGEVFSRSNKVFFLSNVAASTTIILKRMMIVMSNEIENIIFFGKQTASLEVRNTFYTKEIRASSID